MKTDIKRARFRADSKPHEDKLVLCSQLRCGESPRPPRVSSRLSRKRTRVDDDAEDVEESPSVASSHSGKSTGHKKTASMGSSTKGEEVEEGEKARSAKRLRTRKRSSVSMLASKSHEESEVNQEDAMDVDIKDKEISSTASKVHPSPPKSPRRAPAATKPHTKPKTVSSSPKPRSKGRTVQKSPLSASFTAGSGIDVANTTPPPPLFSKERPSTPTKKRTRAQIVEVEILKRSPSAARVNGLKKTASVGSLKAGAGLKKKGEKSQDGRLRQKKIGEVVETSIDGEAEWS